MTALAHHWGQIRDALAAERERTKAVVRTEETDFLPAALEIIERPVSPTARLTAWVLLAGLLFTVVWMTFARIDIVASAPGQLIPGDNVKLIQPADPGVVRAILVKDNQYVRAGQGLVELDPTVSAAEVAQAAEALMMAQLDAARNRAILSALDGHGLQFQAPPGTPPEIVAAQTDLARTTLAEINGSASSRSGDMAAAMAARSEAAVQVAKLNETLPLLDEQIEANTKLLDKGFVSKLRVIEMRRLRLAAAKDRDIAMATVRKSTAEIQSASGTLAQSRAQARAAILDYLLKAETAIKLRQEELAKAEQKSRLQHIVSPVDGRVTQLAIHTIGGVVETAKPIMIIVPSGGEFVAEVRVLNKDVGFVREGQPVTVKLTAFPFTRYGTIDGRVESISSDAIEDEKLGLVYRARIALAKQAISRSGESFPLNAGMQTTADIRTGRRSVLSYLLSPISETRQEAGRER